MSWTNVSLISTGTDWQYTEEFEGDYVRIRHLLGVAQDDVPYGFTGLVAQAFNFVDDVELFNIRKLYPFNEEDIFPVINPFPGRSRRLAVRGQRKYETRINWRVVIDVWTGSGSPDLNDITLRLEDIQQKLSRLSIIEQKLDLILENTNSTDGTDSTDEDLFTAYMLNLI